MPWITPTQVTATRAAAASVRKHFSIALALLALIGVAPLLGACHTTAGAGRDISATGHAITGSANKHTP